MKEENKMAIKVEFEAWLNEIKTFDWGYVAKVVHDQRAKNQAGEWETVAKDYIDVTISEDQMHAIDGANKILVVGTLKVDAYENKQGLPKPSLKVRASEVRPVDRKSAESTVRDVLGVQDAPF